MVMTLNRKSSGSPQTHVKPSGSDLSLHKVTEPQLRGLSFLTTSLSCAAIFISEGYLDMTLNKSCCQVFKKALDCFYIS